MRSQLKGMAESHRQDIVADMDHYQISVSELARVSEMSRPQLNQYLNGTVGNPTTTTLDRIYKSLEKIKKACEREAKRAKAKV